MQSGLGGASERRLAVHLRPAWRHTTGMPNPTRLSENREMDPLLDIQSFMGGTRLLDTKGMLGARAVQQWKEMLRC